MSLVGGASVSHEGALGMLSPSGLTTTQSPSFTSLSLDGMTDPMVPMCDTMTRLPRETARMPKPRGPRIVPLSRQSWDAFVELFGANGACGGCWCMLWRVRARDWKKRQGAGNRRAMRELVARARAPGVLAMVEGEAVGWCAVAPRREYVRLESARAMRAVDDQPVWSISCLYIRKDWRRRGLSAVLLQGAAELARSQGASIVEGYPVSPRAAMPDVFAWTGTTSAFEKAGFREVHRWLPNRPVMRLRLR